MGRAVAVLREGDKMIRTSLLGAACAAAVASCATAGFDTVCATFNGVDPGSGVSYSLNFGDNWHDTTAGMFNWTRTGGTYSGAQDNFLSFCTELGENVSNGNNYCYEVIPLEIAPNSDPMGGARADLIRELFGRYYTPAFGAPLSRDEATAMQLAIWEIVFETRSTLDLSRGRARFTTGNDDAFKLAESYLKSLNGHGPMNNTIVVMSAEGVQDQIIPTPGTLALAGMGLVAAGRRRR